jgi:hypothetical protein
MPEEFMTIFSYLVKNEFENIIIKNRDGKIVYPLERFKESTVFTPRELFIQFILLKNLKDIDYFRLLNSKLYDNNSILIPIYSLINDCQLYNTKLMNFILENKDNIAILKSIIESNKYDELTMFNFPKTKNERTISLCYEYVTKIINDDRKEIINDDRKE